MKAGFVCLVGAPNVGKSTLINTLVGKKISIVSDKPQTTRNRINGVLNLPDGQIVFVDTPGIHNPVHRLGQYIVKIAMGALEGNDLIVFMTSAEEIRNSDRIVAERLKNTDTPIVGVINKIDAAKERVLEEIDGIFRTLNLAGVYRISSTKREGLNELVGGIIDLLPESMPYYPDDMMTDRPLVFMISEIVREKIFSLTRQELPYSTAVTVDYMEEEEGLLKIWATILAERASQKPILLGKGGKMVKQMGTLARKDIELLLDEHVFLSLHVKIKPKWTENERTLNELFKNDLG